MGKQSTIDHENSEGEGQQVIPGTEKTAMDELAEISVELDKAKADHEQKKELAKNAKARVETLQEQEHELAKQAVHERNNPPLFGDDGSVNQTEDDDVTF